MTRLVSVFSVLLLGIVACAERQPAADTARGTDAMMNDGVNLLYRASNPVAAEATFRQVLAQNPAHYGARYQLAMALDRGGRPAEARPEWQVVLKQAESYNDTLTIRVARERIARPDTASQDAMMALGLDLLYRQNNPAAAAEQFRKVLVKNANHYGATYQLATALDRAGQKAQARPLWQRVLGMATGYRDSATVRTAREKLAGR